MDKIEKNMPKLSGLGKLMGMELDNFSNGKCMVTAVVLESHLNAGGVAHGGLHATMLDTALGGGFSFNDKETRVVCYCPIGYFLHQSSIFRDKIIGRRKCNKTR